MRRRSSLCFLFKIYIFYGETPFLLSLYHKTFLCGSFGEKLSQRKETALSRLVSAGRRAFPAAAAACALVARRLFFVPGACFLRGGAPSGEEIINIM